MSSHAGRRKNPPRDPGVIDQQFTRYLPCGCVKGSQTPHERSTSILTGNDAWRCCGCGNVKGDV